MIPNEDQAWDTAIIIDFTVPHLNFNIYQTAIQNQSSKPSADMMPSKGIILDKGSADERHYKVM